MSETLRSPRTPLVRFLVAIALMGVVGGLYETTFSNYLKDVFAVGDAQRGVLEFPRELPGFLVTFVAGALAGFALNRTGAFAYLMVAAGLVGMAFVPGRFGALILFMMLWSTGAHLSMPVISSITLSLSTAEKRATWMGKMGAVAVSGTVVGAAAIAVLMRPGWLGFRSVYLIAAGIAVAAAVVIGTMGRVERHGAARRRAFVFKRSYWLYYILCAIFGARKQVFMTFGLWVIVKLFAREPSTIAKLWIVCSLLGLFVQPMVGRLIDRFGEMRMLFFDGLLLATVCGVYAIAGRYAGAGTHAESIALVVVMACYVVDNLAFSLSMARTTYLSKIVERHEDLPGGLAVGVSIDHAVSMSLPTLGGIVWAVYGFQYVFWGAMCVALCSSVASLFIRIPEPAAEMVAQEA